MRLLLLTVAALVAFAGNSVLNRAALAGLGMDPALFTALRLVSGAVVLGALVAMRAGGAGALLRLGSWTSAAALTIYAVLFSYAYVTLDAGLGALVLFGAVQVTMFAGALWQGERPGAARWAGSALGLGGLAVLFLPGAATPPAAGTLMMLAAGVGWGLYSLRGAGATDPLATTGANFLRAAPAGVLLALLPAAAGGSAGGAAGVGLAVASGALASGLGYAVWYGVLPRLAATTAAIAQLTVPLIALAGGAAFLREAPEPAFWPAAAMILGGVALAVLRPRVAA